MDLVRYVSTSGKPTRSLPARLRSIVRSNSPGPRLLWQPLILFRWNPRLAHIPVESLVYEHQAEYNQALPRGTDKADSAPFIEFMLRMIFDAVSSAATPPVAPQVTPQVEWLRQTLVGEMSREKIQSTLGLQGRKSFRERYLRPALAEGLIEMTLPEKPNSRLQKSRLTDEGRCWPQRRDAE